MFIFQVRFMTRAEIVKEIYTGDVIYKPPFEHRSAALEIARGCNYSGCFFCDFCRDDYLTIPLEKVRRNAQLLSEIIGENESLHLLGCNPMCLDTDFLLRTLDYIHEYLPGVSRITAYARADSILAKKVSELTALNRAGLTELHVGLESGSERVLRLQNKGETVSDIESALNLVSQCGFLYHLSIILGLGGRSLSNEHAEKTAEVISRLSPVSIWSMALKLWPGTPLYSMAESGKFDAMDYLEILKEERYMLSLSDVRDYCLYVDSTVLGKYTVFVALPDGIEEGLKKIDSLIEEAEKEKTV